MRTLVKCLLLGVVAIESGSCRTSQSGETSQAKDLPSFLQSERVLAYRGKSPDELDELFISAPSPTEFPKGYATGIHLIPANSQAKVPLPLTVVTKGLWKGKYFLGSKGVMTDEVFGPNLGVGAQLRIESMAEALARYQWQGMDARAIVDERPSLITDYRGYLRDDIAAGLTKDTRGWVDECRVIEPEAPAIWLCRSTYNGVFWGHVVLQMGSSD